ncbi:glycosyltransferase [Synechococcales cyanobacterium C]|uniref:Glycosyltransferase n=1 Tax=Petrachloros mirabilis ULC683 TaxID=2781853 RepID=A0A8K2A1D5_9CYAN|nr:glycosyltransferase family 4 protein [Petrachloros mirabilis]NCJ07652.1 glycosyltransferase [Petrachloros mirabilis ULC683]
MNVLHINQSDIGGGAAIAGYRLHQGLLTQGIDSKLLVGDPKTQSERVDQAAPTLFTLPERVLWRISPRFGLNHIHRLSSFDIPQHPFYQAADILNFHNLHTGYFNYLALPKLTATKPAVFTLHDMWSFTGHCAYSYDCTKWQTGCGCCPYPNTYPAIRRDATHLEWRLKDWVYSRSKLAIATPSRWLTEQAQASLLNRLPIYYIPYGIDTEAYCPLDPELCRRALGLPQGQYVLLFSADSLTDPRKGGDLLWKALMQLPDSLKAKTTVLTFGSSGEVIADTISIKTMNLGYVSCDRIKSMAYSAADLFLFPTRADNLPLVLQESMACGTPMVSFKIGGVPDLVRPGETGYLAEPEDIEDFRNGIVQLLEDPSLRQHMAQRSREIAAQEYSLELQAERYINLYQKVLDAVSA